jgi:ABC-type Fe3+-siderophore transport system permease subunit
MDGRQGVRTVWLKVLYWYTILGAGGAGLWVLLAPATFAEALRMPSQDPFILGVGGGVWLASGVVAAVGLRAPLVFAPIFLIQLGYKSLWLVAVFLPEGLRGSLPPYAWVLAGIFASYVALDLVAIPFGRLAGR